MACERRSFSSPSEKPPSSPPVTQGRSRIMIHVGAQRYAMDISCEATPLPTEPAPSGNASMAGGCAGSAEGIRQDLLRRDGGARSPRRLAKRKLLISL